MFVVEHRATAAAAAAPIPASPQSIAKRVPFPSPPRRLRRLVTRASNASTALFAKEMERVAAKEALLFAVKDAGGLNASKGSNDSAILDIVEKLLALERLNPTPRPTTSPLLEGLWKFEWAGARSPALMASKFLITTLPSTLLSSDGLTLRVMDGMAKATLHLKVLSLIETSFVLTTSLTAQGPLRLQEQYVDGVLAPPAVKEGSVPTQVQGLYEQFVAAIDRLPESVKETLSGGLKLPFGGGIRYERLLLVSYLDEEVLVARDSTGAPDILSRLEVKYPVAADPDVTEYQS